MNDGVEFLPTRRRLVLLFALAVTLRLFVFGYMVHEPRKFFAQDSDGYNQRAINLVQHGVFAGEEQPPFTADLLRTPAYPAFLAAVYWAVGYMPAAVIALQALIGGLCVVLTVLLARELRAPPAAAWLAGLLVAVEPLSVLYTNRLLTEIPFTTVLLAAVWTLVRFWRGGRPWWLLGSAALMALAALIRPISQFLPIALLPLFVLAAGRPRLRSLGWGVVFVALSLALTNTWAVRNYQQTGLWTISNIGDANLMFYRARAVLATREGIGQEQARDRLQAEIKAIVAERNLSASETVELQRRQAFDVMLSYPGTTLLIHAKGLLRILFDPGYSAVCTMLDRQNVALECFPEQQYSMEEPGMIGKAFGKLGQMDALQLGTLLFSTLLLGASYLAAVVGLLAMVRRREWLPLALLLLLIAYFLVLSAGPEGHNRFRLPFVPYYAIAAGTGAVAIGEWLGRRRGARGRAGAAPESSAALPNRPERA